MRGRKPKPTYLHLVNGNPGRRPRNRKEPKPPRCIPSPPEHLSDDARVAWSMLAAKLDRMRVLTEADAWALEELAETYVEVVQIRRRIARDGRVLTVKNKRSGTRKISNPLVIQYSDAAKRFRALMGEFGLTPASRPRINAGPLEDRDPLQEKYGL